MSLKVKEGTWKRFCDVAAEKDISKSKLFSDMVFSNYIIDREQAAANLVELMDSVSELESVYGVQKVQRVRKAGERICQSLLIR